MRFILPLSAAAVLSVVALAAPAHATGGCNARGWEQGWFSDVRGCHSYYPAIKYVQEQGIVEGYPDGTFHPDAPINRAEFVKILVGASKSWSSDDHCGAMPGITYFPDADWTTTWFGDYVCFAQEQRWVDGYPDGTFKPGNLINYAEAAKIVANAYGLRQEATEEGDDRWYVPYSFALLKKHAVPPTVESYSEPLTRGEMAEMIYRLETAKTSMEGFDFREDGTAVFSYEIASTLFPRDGAVTFHFPGTLFGAKEGTMTAPDLYADGGQRMVHALNLAHVRPLVEREGCNGMAGPGEYCRPSESKLTISIGMIDRPVEYLKLGMAWRDPEDVPMVDGRPAIGFWEGVECEGLKYVFVPLDATRSLVIRRTFDCNVQQGDQLTAEEQDALFTSFLESIELSGTYVPQSAPTMQVSLLMCGYDAHNEPERNAPTVSIQRTVPRSSSVADMTLRALLNAGMNAEANMSPCEGVETLALMYRGVTIVNGVATVMLSQSFHTIFGENETASLSAQRSITANLKQFPSVQSVRYVVVP
jgi:hypothetical protein